MASTYTTTFHLEKPEYKVLRFDIPLNADFDAIDLALKDFPSGTALGSVGNHPEVVLTEGVKWRDTTNHLSKVRNGSSAWEAFHTDTIANLSKDVAAPASPAAGSFYSYCAQVSSISSPHWKRSDGIILKLYQIAHVADIDATVITALTNEFGTADGTFEDIGATNTGDVSGAIENNFQECSAVLAILKTIIDDLRTKFNAHLLEHENLGLHATS